ncbi:MAG: hypothetical protein IJG63_06380 [Oscillospiraceae bacterium]|nr:hypothetical protein [Oscillospiraceae bacterium]
MLKLNNIYLPCDMGTDALPAAVSKAIGIKQERILGLKLLKLSVDSRKKSDVHFVCTAAFSAPNEGALLRRHIPGLSEYVPNRWHFPYYGFRADSRPVVAGMGPAGLFAALCLADAGLPCTVLERGLPVEKRMEDVARFWDGGSLDSESNVQFGEGGAGAFSDGKLTTGISDQRIAFVLRKLVEYGAPEDIQWLSKPHIGTDRLRAVVKNIRARLLQAGCDIRFGHRLDSLGIRDGRLTSVGFTCPDGPGELTCSQLILAPGNSARDTFRMLAEAGAEMEPKNFAVGVRIEHRQDSIDMAQYGNAATLGTLPASDYKLAVHLDGGRGVFTFCVCPGGSVVAAASEQGGLVTNGMSEYARDGENCNGGLLVGVGDGDFEGLFGGMDFQRSLEEAAFRLGGGDYTAPAQLVGDFLARRPSTGCGAVKPSYMPGVRYCNLWDCLPESICQALAEALPKMDAKIHGFADPEAVLTAVETRSSCPVRIVRGADMCSSIAGLYPCGEGAGYAGGIMTAAVDGIKAAEALCASLVSQHR